MVLLHANPPRVPCRPQSTNAAPPITSADPAQLPSNIETHRARCINHQRLFAHTSPHFTVDIIQRCLTLTDRRCTFSASISSQHHPQHRDHRSSSSSANPSQPSRTLRILMHPRFPAVQYRPCQRLERLMALCRRDVHFESTLRWISRHQETQLGLLDMDPLSSTASPRPPC